MNSENYQNILFSKQDGVGIITLNRPSRYNAIDTAMCIELQEAFKAARDDSGIKALLIKSCGRAFCSGGDIKEMIAENDTSMAHIMEHTRSYQDMAKLLIEFPKPTVCAVQGAAAGAGFSIALACDVIIGSDEAKFSQSFVQVGLVPDCGSTYLLSRLIGRAKAKDLVFSGRTVNAEEALELGILTKLVSGKELDAIAFAVAAEYAKGPSLAMSLAKKAIDSSLESTLEMALETETAAQCICFSTEDHQEGIRAFIEKRKPNFNK